MAGEVKLTNLPDVALSVRQPWTHALAMGWKGLENRDWNRANPAIHFRGDFCLHASTGMTREEYEDAAGFISERGFKCPDAADLKRGGIIAVARVTGIVRESSDPWFFGRIALVIEDATPIEFIPCAGSLGFFKWQRAADDYPPKPAKWMLTKSVKMPAVQDSFLTAPLFAGRAALKSGEG